MPLGAGYLSAYFARIAASTGRRPVSANAVCASGVKRNSTNAFATSSVPCFLAFSSTTVAAVSAKMVSRGMTMSSFSPAARPISASLSHSSAASPMPFCRNVFDASRAFLSSTSVLAYSARTRSYARLSVPPPARATEPQFASRFHCAPPLVLGLGVTTPMPLAERSDHSLMPFGLPGRTPITIRLVVAMPLPFVRACQPGSMRPVSSILVTSGSMARCTMSASRPSATARACEPEPPYDSVNVTFSPVFSFQSAWKAGMIFL